MTRNRFLFLKLKCNKKHSRRMCIACLFTMGVVCVSRGMCVQRVVFSACVCLGSFCPGCVCRGVYPGDVWGFVCVQGGLCIQGGFLCPGGVCAHTSDSEADTPDVLRERYPIQEGRAVELYCNKTTPLY